MAKNSHRLAVSSAAPKSSKKRLDSIRIRFAHNGGHTVEHEYTGGDPGMYHKPELHAFGSTQETIKHLTKHLAGVGRDSKPGGKPDHENADDAAMEQDENEVRSAKAMKGN